MHPSTLAVSFAPLYAVTPLSPDGFAKKQRNDPQNTAPEATKLVHGKWVPARHTQTVAEVYALGTVLFEILYGHPAFRSHELAADRTVKLRGDKPMPLADFLKKSKTAAGETVSISSQRLLLSMLGNANERPLIADLQMWLFVGSSFASDGSNSADNQIQVAPEAPSTE